MAESRKPSDESSSHPPPPSDPFERFKMPWPRTEKDDENPFIQFRRSADEAFNSFFSGFPKLFGTPQQQHQNWQDHFQKEIEEHLRKSTETEEGIRKQIEQNFEEMRQAFRKQQGPEHDSEKRLTPVQPWWQSGDSAKCPALQGELSENAKKCPALYDKEGNAKTDLNTPKESRSPWWTRGNASKCPALNEERSDRAQKCPVMFDKAGNAKTELDAYENIASPSREHRRVAKIDTFPYEWSSGLGWDGKVKKSLEQAHGSNNRSWAASREARLKRQLTEEEQSRPEVQDPNARIRSRPQSRWMNPFTTPQNTLPWLMLSPYSPVYLCNPDQPMVGLARFTSSLEEPFSMGTMRIKERPALRHDTDVKIAKALPWADAFEDLISLEHNGRMVDRNASTFKTPKTWIHDMAKRGSLGPTWGFNDQGQLAQMQEWPSEHDFAGFMRRKASHDRMRQAGADQVVDAVVKQQAQSTRDAENEQQQEVQQRGLRNLRVPPPEISQEPAVSDVVQTDGNQIWHDYQMQLMLLEQQNRERMMRARAEQDNALIQDRAATSWASSEAPINQDSQTLVSTVTRTETRTLPNGSILVTSVSKRTFANGREENEEDVEIIHPLPHVPMGPAPGKSAIDEETQTLLQEAFASANKTISEAEAWKSAREAMQGGPGNTTEAGKRIPASPQMQLELLKEQEKRDKLQPGKEKVQGKKSGWFWS